MKRPCFKTWMTDPGSLVEKERLRLEWILEMLTATRDRMPNFACHGLHEWAMVDRGKQVRHEKTLKLRLPQADIDAVVESQAICCSHHDALEWLGFVARLFRIGGGSAQSRHACQPV